MNLAQRIFEILPTLQAVEPLIDDKVKQKFGRLSDWFLKAMQHEAFYRNLPPETRFQQLRAFRKVFYPELRKIVTPLGIKLRMAREQPGDYFFSGYAQLGQPQPVIEFSSNQEIGNWLQASPDIFFKRLWLSYVTTIQHEMTHILQYQRLPTANVSGTRALRMLTRSARQVGPTGQSPHVPHQYRQWSTLKIELEPIAAEIARDLLLGRPAWKNPRLDAYHAYGMTHPATRRLLKKISLLLQGQDRPDLLLTFVKGFRDYQAVRRESPYTVRGFTGGRG